MLRKLVAVGTDRLRSMLAAMAAPAPRIGSPILHRRHRRRDRTGPRPVDGTASACRRPALPRGRDGDRRDGRLVVGEELAPRLADRTGIGRELLVHLLDEPRVGAESWPCRSVAVIVVRAYLSTSSFRRFASHRGTPGCFSEVLTSIFSRMKFRTLLARPVRRPRRWRLAAPAAAASGATAPGRRDVWSRRSRASPGMPRPTPPPRSTAR